MKIRNPFKDYLFRWKDDATDSEKFIWGGVSCRVRNDDFTPIKFG